MKTIELRTNDLLPVGALVRHKTSNYVGEIDGTTTVREHFTGNTNCEWQYKILRGQSIVFAPPEDLELIDSRTKTERMAVIVIDLESFSKYKYNSNKSACEFTITVHESRLIPVVYDTNKWVYTVVRSRTAIRKLTRNSPNCFTLNIIGRGYDNRCRWCRTFRTALKTRVEKIIPNGYVQLSKLRI